MTLLTRTHDTWDESECLHLGAIFRIMQFTHRRPVPPCHIGLLGATLHARRPHCTQGRGPCTAISMNYVLILLLALAYRPRMLRLRCLRRHHHGHPPDPPAVMEVRTRRSLRRGHARGTRAATVVRFLPIALRSLTCCPSCSLALPLRHGAGCAFGAARGFARASPSCSGRRRRRRECTPRAARVASATARTSRPTTPCERAVGARVMSESVSGCGVWLASRPLVCGR